MGKTLRRYILREVGAAFAAGLGIFTFVLLVAMVRLSRAGAPCVAEGAQAPAAPYMDPVPQALVLTAIIRAALIFMAS